MDEFDFGSIADAVKGFLDDYGMQIGMMAQAGGTMARRAAIRRIQRQQEAEMAAERERQAALQGKLDSRLAGTVQQFSPAAQEAERQALAARYRTTIQPGAETTGEYSTDVGTEGAPQEVKDRAAKTLATSLQKGRDYTRALAEMASYGGQGQQQGIRLGDARRDMGEILRQSRASSKILPYELDRANLAGRGLMTGSDVLNGLGDAAFVYGASAPRRQQKRAASSDIPFYGVGAAPY